jgi:hypothetical protein
MKVKITDYKDSGKQNVSIRIDSWDVYNADITLARIILPMLKAFKKKNSGCPGEFLANTSNPPTETEESEAFAKWNACLNKMIFAFKQISNGNTVDKNSEKVQEGLNLFAKYYLHLWL